MSTFNPAQTKRFTKEEQCASILDAITSVSAYANREGIAIKSVALTSEQLEMIGGITSLETPFGSVRCEVVQRQGA